MKSTHIMLDLETLAIHPTAAIIQIGAVALTPVLELGATFKAAVAGDLPGFKIEPRTLLWHQNQNKRNFDLITSNAIQLERGIADFDQWVRGFEGKKIIWCCGTDFDIPIITNAFNYFSRSLPWAYANVRDFRTLREMWKTTIPYENTGTHDALDDARSQMNHLIKLYEASLIQLE